MIPVSTCSTSYESPMNVFRDGVAMGRPGKQHAQNQKVEPALQQTDAGRPIAAHFVGILLLIL